MPSDSEEKPELRLRFTTAEWFLVALGLLSAVTLIVTWILMWPMVPERIPPDLPINWSERDELLLVPIIGLKLFLILTLLAWVPSVYNNPPWKISPGNVETQYRLMRRLILMLAIWILWVCLGSFMSAVLLATGRIAAIPVWLLAGGFLCPVLLLAGYHLMAWKNRG